MDDVNQAISILKSTIRNRLCNGNGICDRCSAYFEVDKCRYMKCIETIEEYIAIDRTVQILQSRMKNHINGETEDQNNGRKQNNI